VVFGNKDKSGNFACNFMYVQGITSFDNVGINGIRVAQEDTDGRLSFTLRIPKADPIFLCYKQIASVGVASEKEVIEKSKNVVGRAAVGGLAFGPLGAIIGGASGIGNKQKFKSRSFFVINYHPANDSEEIKVLSFEIVGASTHWEKFINALKTKIPQQPEQPVSQYL